MAGRLVNSYVARLPAAAVHDPELRVFLDVSGMVAPPPALTHPDRMARVC